MAASSETTTEQCSHGKERAAAAGAQTHPTAPSEGPPGPGVQTPGEEGPQEHQGRWTVYCLGWYRAQGCPLHAFLK